MVTACHDRLAQRLALCSVLLLWTSFARAEVFVQPALTASDSTPSSELGYTLARDGDVLVATALYAEANGVDWAGAVYVYQRDAQAGTWVERTKLVSQASARFDGFGTSVALDGDTLLVGAPGADVDGSVDQGRVHVFDRNTGGADNWGEVVVLTDSSVGALGRFGTQVALEGDLLAVTSERRLTNIGQVTLFERGGSAPGWSKLASIAESDVGGMGHGDGSSASRFGAALALAGDLLWIGAPEADVSDYDANDGAVYLFTRDAGDSSRFSYITRLIAPEAAQCFGGRPLIELELESAEVRTEVQRCAREDSLSDGDDFGIAIALDGDFVAIGASAADAGPDTVRAGAVYAFQRAAEPAYTWNAGAKLVAAEAQSDAAFGGALGLAGDTLLVGEARAAVGDKAHQGAAYVFERDVDRPESWQQIEQLFAADGFSGHLFGTAVALDGAARLIAAIGREQWRGAIYSHVPSEEPPVVEPEEPAYLPTGTLVNDSLYEAPSGVVLGAAEHGVLDPIDVWVHEVAAPDAPLPADVTPAGAFFNVGAVDTQFLSNETPFAVGLPVADHLDASQLEVAMSFPASLALRGEQVGDLWRVVGGDYDAENRLYFVTLSGLLKQGSTLGLVMRAGPPAAPPARAGRSSREDDDSPLFEVTCYLSDPAECEARSQQVRDQLDFAYHTFTIEHGFPAPALKKTRHWKYCSSSRCFIASAVAPFRNIGLYPSSVPCDDGAAKYDFLTRNLFVCEFSDFDDLFEANLSHELFHAHQYAYDPVWYDHFFFREHHWVLEGTAEAAAGSITSVVSPAGSSLKRNWTQQRAPRRVDQGFADVTAPMSLADYEAQDFWVYLGLRDARPLGYLTSLLNQGSSAAALDGQFQSQWGASLGDEYWRWIKNQTMLEDGIDFSPDGPPTPEPSPPAPLREPPCQLQTVAVAHDASTLQAQLEHKFSYPSQVSTQLSLSPLQSDVVEITFAGVPDWLQITVEAAGAAGTFKHKVYLDQAIDTANAACRTVQDGDRGLARNFVGKAYVLIANTAHADAGPTTFQVRVQPQG